MQIFQRRQADQCDQGKPVPGGTVRRDGTQTQRAEGGGAEGLEGIERGEQCVWVLQDQAAGGDRECGAKGLVRVGDLTLGVAWEGWGGFQGEGGLRADGKVVLVGEVDGCVYRLPDALAK